MRIDIGMVYFVSSRFRARNRIGIPFVGMYSEMPSEITLSCESLCTIGKTADKRSDHDIMPRTDSVTIVDELFDGIIDIGIIRRSR
jgi:hypothetical protein